VTAPTAQAVTIELPWHEPPLSLNDRHATRIVEAAAIAKVRRDAGWIVKSVRARLGRPAHVRVELRYQPRRRGRRDEDNLTATYKPVCDAIVDAGIVPDDTGEYMTKVLPALVPPQPGQRHGRMWLIITPAEPLPPAEVPDA
jgi:crossover junction endodeoxyribonuclease RusA